MHADEDNKCSVMLGLVSSAPVLAASALMMGFVSGGFLLNGNTTVKRVGVGLAVPVILDATVVRYLPVHVLMILLGRKN